MVFMGKADPHFMDESNALRITIGLRSRFFSRLYSSASLNYPMELTTKLATLGTTAASSRESIHDKASQAPLYEHDIVVVNVDKTSHRPVPFDKEFVEKYSRNCSNVVPKTESPSKPSDESVICCQRQAVWSDVDYINHVNNSNYVKFCLDAMSLFMKDNSYWSSLLVKQVTSVYKGEVKEGNIMDMYMWQSKTPNVLHFQIEVKSKVVCKVTVQVYSKDICSKL